MRRRTARSSSRASPARRSTSSTSRARSPSSRSRSPARRAGTCWGETCTQYFFIDQTFLERPELRGREVRLHAAAARQGEPGSALERGAHRHPLGDLDRPLRLPLRRPEGRGQGRLLADPERRPRAREPAADDPRVRRARPARSRSTAWSSCWRRTRRSSSASTRARARSPSAPTPTSSSSTRRSSVTISASTHHSALRLQPLRGHRGDRLARGRAAARQRARRERRARRQARASGQFIKRAKFGDELKPAALAAVSA